MEKKELLELKNISIMKNSVNRIICRLVIAEENISALDYTVKGTIQNEDKSKQNRTELY